MNQRTSIAPYTAADLDRYHTGRMSPAERHALEKAALEDPFLSDAIEGFGTVQGHGADDMRTVRQQLQKRLDGAVGRGGSGSVHWLNPLWRVAAMVVILAGAALLVFRLSVPKKPEQIAQQRRSTSTIDSASISSSTVETRSDSGPQEISEKIVTRTPAPTPGGSAMENTPPVPRHEPDQRPRLKEPADIAAVESKPVTDHPEKADEVAPSASPAPAVTLKLSKKAEESTPPLAKDQEEPAGGWVTESRNKATAPGSGMKRESKGPQPKGGWEAYRNYLTTNRVMPAERNNNTDTASVLVSFTIDGQGRPTDIRIERALCPACDKEAVRLVKDGPGWHQGPGGHSRTRMEIPF